MRKLLLAGVALGAVSALMSASPARADDTAAAVFPVTSETDLAGYNGPSLNGAAPGSVQVNLGGRMFDAIWFQNNPKGTPGYAQSPQPQFMSYFFLYPGFDYASPSGVHFGAQAEIRVTSSPQGGGSGAQNNSPMPWFHQAFSYASSPIYGKIQFGLPSGALTANAVGTGDDFGTGLFFGWYSTDPYIPWVMGDAYDNYVTQQKVTYTTATWGGFTGAVSFQPTAVSMNYADNLTVGEPPTSNGLLSRNRVEVAVKYAGNFGALGTKFDIAYVHASAEKSGNAVIGQDVSFGNIGAQLNYAGFELEGSVETGQFNYALSDNGNPMGPEPLGAKNTTAYVLGVGYGTGPFKVGAVYYNVQYDQMDFEAGTPSALGRVSGEGLGGSYTVGPGVVLYLDAITASMQAPIGSSAAFAERNKVYPSGIGIGTFFTW